MHGQWSNMAFLDQICVVTLPPPNFHLYPVTDKPCESTEAKAKTKVIVSWYLVAPFEAAYKEHLLTYIIRYEVNCPNTKSFF